MSRIPVRLSTCPGPAASGALASLAAGASVTLTFDLGQDWASYSNVQISIGAVGLTGTMSIYGADTETPSTIRPLGDYISGAIALGIPVTSNLVAIVQPMGRYIQAVVTNTGGGTFGGPGNVAFAAYA